MRAMFALLAISLGTVAGPVAAQIETDADRIAAQAMYEQQRQRDQVEADRVAKTNLDRQSDYDLYIAKQQADYDAKMAQWRADVARQKADYDARVARCLGGDRTACAPR